MHRATGAAEDAASLDSRVGVLSDLVRPLIEREPEPAWYIDVLTLWQRIEARSMFAKLDA